MKKLMTLSIVFIVFTVSAESFAQTFRIKAGLNLSKMLDENDYNTYSDDYNMKPGFLVGATAEIPLNRVFFIETGMFLSTKGYKVDIEEKVTMFSTYSHYEKLNLFYADIPLTAKASFDFGGVNIYGLFGPYIGIGLSGKLKVKETRPQIGQDEAIRIDEEINVKWGSGDDDDFKRLDYGLTVGVGVEKKSVQVGLTYSLGLANISTTNGTKTKNRVLGISIGYRFGGK